jgi:DNA (cytosine-5)-methyltransferase 1
MAGFKVTHAVDSASDVWPTYAANFPEAKLYRGSIDEYVRNQRREVRADILHLSPPCQYFSPAHTHESANDDANIFALFSCGTLINKVKPRLITVEETFGLTHERHRIYLHTLINDLTQYGYSVRWKVIRLCTWGSAQDRKRLVMIAAGPGEQLPPFPVPTHSEHGLGGTTRFNTMRQALAGLRSGDDLHDLHAAKKYVPPRPAYDPNRLAGTLTCGGADFCYPDGTRDFTLREFASLQGFPRYHRFLGTRTNVKRQIGNAFPPNTVRVLYGHLKAWLLERDGMITNRDLNNDDVIMLDAPDTESLVIVDDSDDDSLRRRSVSVESASDSDASIIHDIQDVLEDEDDDVVMVGQYDRSTIDLT